MTFSKSPCHFPLPNPTACVLYKVFIPEFKLTKNKIRVKGQILGNKTELGLTLL